MERLKKSFLIFSCSVLLHGAVWFVIFSALRDFDGGLVSLDRDDSRRLRRVRFVVPHDAGATLDFLVGMRRPALDFRIDLSQHSGPCHVADYFGRMLFFGP